MYMSDLNVRSALMKNPTLTTKRNLLCFSFDDMVEEYTNMSRYISLKSDHIKYASITLNKIYDRLLKVKIYGVFDKEQFCPIYFIYDNQIWLLTKNISFDFNADKVVFQKNKELQIEILHHDLLQKLCDEIGISILPTFSDVVPLSFERHLDYLNNSIKFIINNNKYVDFPSFDQVETLFNTVIPYHNDIARLNSEILQKDMTAMFDKKDIVNDVNISFGVKHEYDPNDIISIEEIDDSLYTKLIHLISVNAFITSFRVDYGDTIKFKELTVNDGMFRYNHNYILNVISKSVIGLLSCLHIPKVRTVDKIDDFNLILIDESNTYHIDLLIAPLTSVIIV